MSVYEFVERSKEYNDLVSTYEKIFDTDFPDYEFFFNGKTEKEVISILKNCIEKNKDVYDLGYCNIGDDTCY